MWRVIIIRIWITQLKRNESDFAHESEHKFDDDATKGRSRGGRKTPIHYLNLQEAVLLNGDETCNGRISIYYFPTTRDKLRET